MPIRTISGDISTVAICIKGILDGQDQLQKTAVKETVKRTKTSRCPSDTKGLLSSQTCLLRLKHIKWCDCLKVPARSERVTVYRTVHTFRRDMLRVHIKWLCKYALNKHADICTYVCRCAYMFIVYARVSIILRRYIIKGNKIYLYLYVDLRIHSYLYREICAVYRYKCIHRLRVCMCVCTFCVWGIEYVCVSVCARACL